jgi:hypothetical protein
LSGYQVGVCHVTIHSSRLSDMDEDLLLYDSIALYCFGGESRLIYINLWTGGTSQRLHLQPVDRAGGSQHRLTFAHTTHPHSLCNRLTPHKIFTSYTRHPPHSMSSFHFHLSKQNLCTYLPSQQKLQSTKRIPKS